MSIELRNKMSFQDAAFYGVLAGLYVHHNLNRNMFFRKKTYCNCTALSVLFFLQEKTMDKLRQCAELYKNLLDIKYKIVLGRKGVKTEIMLSFLKENFFHLIGLHKLKDIRYPYKNSSENFDAIIDGKITYDMISKSKYFQSDDKKNCIGIKYRVEYFIHLLDMLDSNNLIFKYNSKINSWSKIRAEYIFECRDYDEKLYLFIDSNNGKKEMFCKTFFPEAHTDYTARQAKMTLLYKEKINVKAGESIIQFDKLNIPKEKIS